MKKIIFFLAAFVFFYQIPATSTATQVEKHDRTFGISRASKTHFETSISGSKVTITAADLNICDDAIVKAIKHPKPLSVSEAIESIQQELLRSSATGKEIVVDLSTNTICDEGSGLVGNYFSKVNSLRSLNLSWNRITDEGIGNLLATLKPLLLAPSFSSLDITGNYGANKTNIQKYLSTCFKTADQEIVKNKIIYG